MCKIIKKKEIRVFFFDLFIRSSTHKTRHAIC